MMDVGVITKKNIKLIIIGEIIFPNNIPNLNQILLNGVKIAEFKIPNIKKIIEIINDQYLISNPFLIGQIAIIKKNIKKTIPKLLFELILILLFFKV